MQELNAAGQDYTADLAGAWLGIRRRWWIVLGLPALVLVLSLAARQPNPPVYQARVTLAVDIPAEALVPGSDEGTAAKIGEALIDDLSRIISGDVFAGAVAERLDGVTVSPGEVASSLSATDRHRIVDVTVTRSAPVRATPAELAQLEQELIAIAEAVVVELEQNGTEWFARLGEKSVSLTVVDRPKASVLPAPLVQRLELPLRVGLALLLGAAAATTLHVLDPRLYTREQAEAFTGARVLGSVPGEGSSRRGGPAAGSGLGRGSGSIEDRRR